MWCSECDQCHRRCIHTALCKQKERTPSDGEEELLEPGVGGVEGILRIEALWGYRDVRERAWGFQKGEESSGLRYRDGLPPSMRGFVIERATDKYGSRHPVSGCK